MANSNEVSEKTVIRTVNRKVRELKETCEGKQSRKGREEGNRERRNNSIQKGEN